jgi:hypothetical protein
MYLTILIFLQVIQPLGEEDRSRRTGMMQMMQKMMMERMDMDVQNIIRFLFLSHHFLILCYCFITERGTYICETGQVGITFLIQF